MAELQLQSFPFPLKSWYWNLPFSSSSHTRRYVITLVLNLPRPPHHRDSWAASALRCKLTFGMSVTISWLSHLIQISDKHWPIAWSLKSGCGEAQPRGWLLLWGAFSQHSMGSCLNGRGLISERTASTSDFISPDQLLWQGFFSWTRSQCVSYKQFRKTCWRGTLASALNVEGLFHPHWSPGPKDRGSPSGQLQWSILRAGWCLKAPILKGRRDKQRVWSWVWHLPCSDFLLIFKTGFITAKEGVCREKIKDQPYTAQVQLSSISFSISFHPVHTHPTTQANSPHVHNVDCLFPTCRSPRPLCYRKDTGPPMKLIWIVSFLFHILPVQMSWALRSCLDDSVGSSTNFLQWLRLLFPCCNKNLLLFFFFNIKHTAEETE